jgi:hypothetical protein
MQISNSVDIRFSQYVSIDYYEKWLNRQLSKQRQDDRVHKQNI